MRDYYEKEIEIKDYELSLKN